MKEITIKTILTINGREVLISSQDFSESIAEYEREQEYELDDKEIIEYIIQPWFSTDMKMTERPKDIQDAWQKAVNDAVSRYSKEDIESGYARYMEEWEQSMPDNASNQRCREWYGIPQVEE